MKEKKGQVNSQMLINAENRVEINNNNRASSRHAINTHSTIGWIVNTLDSRLYIRQWFDDIFSVA